MAKSKPVTIETLERHKDNPCAVLHCAGCGGSYVANPDYYRWVESSTSRLACSCGVRLRLIHREVIERELT